MPDEESDSETTSGEEALREILEEGEVDPFKGPMEMVSHDTFYPSVDHILGIHKDIIEADEDADSGVANEGYVDYVVEFIEHGHFGEGPETIHEKAYELLRLLAANHPFTDGNKRTALNATWTFYAMNGYEFDYGEEIKAILKLLAVMERMVDREETIDYFEDITYSSDSERATEYSAELTHLTHWWGEHISRRQRVVESIKSGESEEDGEKILNLMMEERKLLTDLDGLCREQRDNIPGELIEYVCMEISNYNEIIEDAFGMEVEESEFSQETRDLLADHLRIDTDLEPKE